MSGATNEAKPRTMSEQEYNAGKDEIYIGSPFINYSSQEMEVALLKKFNGQYCISVKTDFWTGSTILILTHFISVKLKRDMKQKLEDSLTSKQERW